MAMSDESRRVIDAVRQAYGPSESDRARVRQRVVGQLTGARAVTAATHASAAWLASTSVKIVAFGMVICVVGAVVFARYAKQKTTVHAGLGSGVSLQLSAAPARVAELAASAEPPVLASAAAVASDDSPAPGVSAHHALKPTNPNGTTPDVQGEIALLSKAQRALSSGKPGHALQLLDEYARVYPKGTLRQEHDAARIIALCKLGEVSKARALANAFMRAAPQSPLAERVRASCGNSLNTEGAL